MCEKFTAVGIRFPHGIPAWEMLGTVTREQHASIKEQIHSHLKEQGIFSSLKSIVSSALQQGGESSSSDAGIDLSALTAAQRASVLARIVADQAGTDPPPQLPTDGAQQRTLLP